MQRSPITTHILDIACGLPARGVRVVLAIKTGNSFVEIGSGTTDSDGRVSALLPPDHKLVPGIYKLEFFTSDYFKHQEQDGFYPAVEVTFQVKNSEQHYHVPLLLSPFGYSTYRGS